MPKNPFFFYEMVLSSVHNICLGWEIRKLFFHLHTLMGESFQDNSLIQDFEADFP